MAIKILKFTLVLLLVISSNIALITAQGALDGYMKGKGHLDLAPSFSFMRSRDFIGAGGKVYEEPYSGNLLSLFAAYGVTDRFDVVANIPYIFTATQSGLQDGGFYVKYRPVYLETLKRGRLGFILGTGVSLPLSDYEPVAAGALGQQAITTPLRLIVQWDTPWGPFLNFTGGYNWRLDQYRESDLNEVRRTRPDYNPPDPPEYTTLLVKLGLPAKHFYTDIWLEHQYTPSTQGANYEPNVLDLAQAYGVGYTQTGGTIYYSETGRRGVFLSAGKIWGGRNVSRIFRVSVGAVVKI